MIQGLAAGLCLGPRLISPALWLPWVWDRNHGVQPPAVSDLEQFNAVLGWVMSLYNEAWDRLRRKTVRRTSRSSPKGRRPRNRQRRTIAPVSSERSRWPGTTGRPCKPNGRNGWN